MKFILAPDSFKGTLSAGTCATLLREAALRHFPEAECLLLPLADGGEGTLEALKEAMGMAFHSVEVSSPLGEPVLADIALSQNGEKAVLEMARASGLPLVPAEKRNPMKTSTYGTGQLIAYALSKGAKEVTMGIGGSATNDGGMGMLTALGARFFSEDGSSLEGRGENLAKVAACDFSKMNPSLKNVKISVLSDVTNPLLGPKGATSVYGPQKGADSEMLPLLEEGMTRYARVVEKALGGDFAHLPGTGAAGGLGFALMGVLGASCRSGIDGVLDALSFDEKLMGASLVVTGEGSIDAQSVSFGKVISGVAKRCREKKIPLCVIAGSMGNGAEKLYETVEASIITTVRAPAPIQEILSQAEPLFRDGADRLFRLLKIGKSLRE